MSNTQRVTVITLQNVRNYGSALQALATQEIFRSLGCQVDFINYVRKDIVSPVTRIKKWCKGMNLAKKLIYGCILYPSFVRQNKVFTKFLNQYLNIVPTQYTSDEDFKNFPITSDIYCTGSDQTWNSAWNDGILPPLFLNFVPDNVRKIAYAASFGKSKLDTWEIDETRKLLSRYHAISVRESSGTDIIKELDSTADLDRVQEIYNQVLTFAADQAVLVPFTSAHQYKEVCQWPYHRLWKIIWIAVFMQLFLVALDKIFFRD